MQARLKALGRAPSPSAKPEKLLRRVTLTLTGLPPTLEQLDAFIAEPTDEAYAAAVDRLLASKAYAERMTSAWLDLARYSDTDGYQYDIARPAWPWRDWVLQAFDTNMPWDQFTTEQIAGDLLPGATPATQLATGFNRNHAIQGENGLLVNEFRDQYVSDRLDVLGKTWLGLTLGCAKCHDHKFEPISARDSFNVVNNPVHVHDLHATILHLLGVDHERLTALHDGRNERLTDLAGRVVTDILS